MLIMKIIPFFALFVLFFLARYYPAGTLYKDELLTDLRAVGRFVKAIVHYLIVIFSHLLIIFPYLIIFGIAAGVSYLIFAWAPHTWWPDMSIGVMMGYGWLLLTFLMDLWLRTFKISPSHLAVVYLLPVGALALPTLLLWLTGQPQAVAPLIGSLTFAAAMLFITPAVAPTDQTDSPETV